MSEREYYEFLEELVKGGDCDRCSFGIEGNCHLDCDKSYQDFLREEKEFLNSIGS